MTELRADTFGKKADNRTFVTAKDIIIPAGTEVGIGPVRSGYATPHAEIIIGVTKDTTAHWRMDLAEAMETGLVKEA